MKDESVVTIEPISPAQFRSWEQMQEWASSWPVYSFRAEMKHDAFAALLHLHTAGAFHIRHLDDYSLLDGPIVEFSSPMGLRKIATALAIVPDGHRMLQTLELCPASENKRIDEWYMFEDSGTRWRDMGIAGWEDA